MCVCVLFYAGVGPLLTSDPAPEELVCLFLHGEFGSRGAPPRPVKACHASLPARRGSARHCRPSGSWKMLIYIRNNMRKGVPDCPAVPPIGTCVARGFKGCQAFALAEEKILKRYIQKTYEKVICSAGWVSIVLPKKTKTSRRPSSSLTRRRLFQTFCRQVESEVVVKEIVLALQLYWVPSESCDWAKRLDRSCGRASARSSTPR